MFTDWNSWTLRPAMGMILRRILTIPVTLQWGQIYSTNRRNWMYLRTWGKPNYQYYMSYHCGMGYIPCEKRSPLQSGLFHMCWCDKSHIKSCLALVVSQIYGFSTILGMGLHDYLIWAWQDHQSTIAGIDVTCTMWEVTQHFPLDGFEEFPSEWFCGNESSQRNESSLKWTLKASWIF